MSERMIVKLQLPLGGEPDFALIYDKKREYLGLVPVTPDVRRAMGDSVKKFFYAHPAKGGKLMIDMDAPWQEW
jgi:hypothetical protein